MKNMVMKLAILLLGVSLVACSSNTQQENTTVGAATGAVIGGVAGTAFGAGTGRAVAVGVGAVAGAIVGGLVGHNMDSSDNEKMDHAMDHNPTNKLSAWNSKKNGARYKIAPTSDQMSMNGNQNCRKYHTTETINGQTQHVDGIACRQENGNWQPVSNS